MRLANTADLDLAMELADHADSLAMPRFRAIDLLVETKPDLTPVSDADKSVELALRGILSQAHPSDSVIGEEFNQTGKSDRTWIIDPIDGTKNFVRGVPVWATLIALRDSEGVGLGLVSCPALGRRWWALRGHGAWVSEGGQVNPISVSQVADLSSASMSFSDSRDWEAPLLSKLTAATWRQRAYGDFWSHCLVAEGAVDIAAEPSLALYDYAALIPIVVESGGLITDFAGDSLPTTDSSAHPSVLSTNGRLQETVIKLFNPKTGGHS